jgi:hypothetical protein
MFCKHFLAMTLSIGTLLLAPASAQAQQWVELGCRDVDLNVDRDVIRVGRRDGRFTAIRLRAEGNVVHMLDLKVVYGNGKADDLPVKARIGEGKTSGALDLKGADRQIDRGRDDLYPGAECPRPRAHLRGRPSGLGGRFR